MACARFQEARSLELRAAMSLARLYRANADPGKAAAVLRPVYEAFTQGFDTLDMIEARTLLAELA
jgi:predicted ATPase